MNEAITNDNWMQARWRPAMGFTYMAICIFDFIIAPILWSLVQALQAGNVTLQWSPLTLIAGGFFHIAMGAICGVAAWTRGSEKVAGIRSPYPMHPDSDPPPFTPETVNQVYPEPGQRPRYRGSYRYQPMRRGENFVEEPPLDKY